MAKKVAQLLALHATNPGFGASPHKRGVAVHACNSSTREVKAGGTEVQGHPQLLFGLKANLRYKDPVSVEGRREGELRNINEFHIRNS